MFSPEPSCCQVYWWCFLTHPKEGDKWLVFLCLQSSRMEQSPLNWILMRKHQQLPKDFQTIKMLAPHLELLMRLSSWQRPTSMEAGVKKRDSWGRFTETIVPVTAIAFLWLLWLICIDQRFVHVCFIFSGYRINNSNMCIHETNPCHVPDYAPRLMLYIWHPTG